MTLRGLSLSGAIALHLAALLWIAHHPAVLELPPMIMHAALIAPEPLPVKEPEPPTEQKRIEPEPPKPVVKPVKPVRKEVALPQLAAKEDAPSTTVVAPQPPAPAEPTAIDTPPARASTPAPAPVATAPVVAPPPITPPRFDVAYLQNPYPAYPPMSQRLGEVGKLVLKVIVDANGVPTQVSVHESSGYPRLDEAALKTVRTWKFVPARRGDEAIGGGQAFVPISFGFKS